MSATLSEQITIALAQFSSASRLYALNVGAGGAMIEAFAADDEVQGIGGRDVIAVSTDAHIELESLLGQPASLEVLPTVPQKENIAPNAIDPKKPLSQSTIRGIQKLASTNREAYNEVFLHTPRDSYKTLAEGRKRACPAQRGGHERDFSLPPRLQPGYMMNKTIKIYDPVVPNSVPLLKSANEISVFVHNVPLAIKVLRARIRGFFVSMPLDWGDGEKVTPKAPVSPAMIAVNHRKSKQETG